MVEWLDWQPDGALVSEGMRGACRQKLVGCRAETVGEMEPDALPAEETGAKLGGRCAPGFSHDTSKQSSERLTHQHRVDPWSRIEASLLDIRSAGVLQQGPGMWCACSFMVQIDVTRATFIWVLIECSWQKDLRLPVEDLFRTCPRIGKVCD